MDSDGDGFSNITEVNAGTFPRDAASHPTLILWRNTSTGADYLWYMNGATYNGNAQIMTVSDKNWAIVGPK